MIHTEYNMMLQNSIKLETDRKHSSFSAEQLIMAKPPKQTMSIE